MILIFLHECGHLIVAKKFGLKVSAPMFIPFFGAFILLREAPRNAWMEACVGIGGPMFGSIAALLCHLAGIHLGAPLVHRARLHGIFLEPVQSRSRRHARWRPHRDRAFAVALVARPCSFSRWLGFTHPNFVIWLVLFMSLPRIFSLFRKRTEEEQRYFEVPAAQRWTMGAMYFGLIAALVVLMFMAQMQLQSLPHPRHQAREQIV